MEDYRRKLEQLNPNVTLSVELPHAGNGDLYQVRTTIADGLIFYGRATTEEEAIVKCCQKAVKHLMKNNNNVEEDFSVKVCLLFTFFIQTFVNSQNFSKYST